MTASESIKVWDGESNMQVSDDIYLIGQGRPSLLSRHKHYVFTKTVLFFDR